MVNMQPGNDGEAQWYPQLPEGYVQQQMQGSMDYGYQDMVPGMGMQGYGAPDFYPEQSMYGYDMGAGQLDQLTAFNDFPDYGPQEFPSPQYAPDFGPTAFQQGGNRPPFGLPGFPPGGGMPPFGPPGFPPGQGGPQFGPPGQQQGQQAPTAPPPNFTPPYPSGGGAQLFAVDPGAIRGCLYRNTFIWTSRRNGFWMFPTFVGRTSVAGWRWRSRQRRWEYTGIDLNRIDKFSCF